MPTAFKSLECLQVYLQLPQAGIRQSSSSILARRGPFLLIRLQNILFGKKLFVIGLYSMTNMGHSNLSSSFEWTTCPFRVCTSNVHPELLMKTVLSPPSLNDEALLRLPAAKYRPRSCQSQQHRGCYCPLHRWLLFLQHVLRPFKHCRLLVQFGCKQIEVTV